MGTYGFEKSTFENLVGRELDAAGAQEVEADVVSASGVSQCLGWAVSDVHRYVGEHGVDLVDLGWGLGWAGMEMDGVRTMSWVTCFGLKPSAAVTDRLASVDDAAGPGEGRR